MIKCAGYRNLNSELGRGVSILKTTLKKIPNFFPPSAGLSVRWKKPYLILGHLYFLSAIALKVRDFLIDFLVTPKKVNPEPKN